MRIKAVIVASAISMCAFNSAWSQALIPQAKQQEQERAKQEQIKQEEAAKAEAAKQAATTPSSGVTTATAPAKPAIAANCANPNAIGVSRVVSIDTTGGPGFGFEHFKQLDFLRDKEVVLTFDDGPWPVNTPSVLKTLDDECTKAIFFPIGKHATYYPEILKQVAAKGHTIGSHTWSHANLNDKKMTEPLQKEEIEKGFSAVAWALGTPPSPFFRAPALQHPPAMVTYLGERNIAIWSCDLDSFDFKASKPETVIKSVMSKLEKHGKGIVLMHDFQKHTAEALPELMKQLKAGGYKIVQVKAKAPMTTIAQYDEEVVKGLKLPTISSRPVSSVVETISEEK
jgi:peptidoglycan/xylan/chitin deacetylase (PgdA/CDA1 family)